MVPVSTKILWLLLKEIASTQSPSISEVLSVYFNLILSYSNLCLFLVVNEVKCKNMEIIKGWSQSEVFLGVLLL